ncbi:hypothetical protein GWO43_24110 [candidate division KSB1 bacterium]|nr:hypothetical protein [candidate division KSB1 bacterium]NIR73443.1 hypothetical protein [candidate division KSB1 bacterium]NIS27058.1 hypothetical protein [candidate division KSB1 bacterium]NIT73902.1 hypothetical protein [candidate division KSB1 bacterium]NIU27803.1 hypothetical protein [candidate division KSB1 bacterium]
MFTLISANILFAQSQQNLEQYYSQLGMTRLQSANEIVNSKDSELQVSEMQISLSEQRQRDRLFSDLQPWETRRPLPGKFALIKDNFEGNFPGQNWQLLNAPTSPTWKKGARRSFTGSFSLWCGTATTTNDVSHEEYSNNSLSWLISAPYDLSNANYAALNFYVWLKTEQNFDALFFGVSTNGSDFHGLTMSGDSKGWQFVNLNLNQVPGLGKVPGSPEVRVGFCFASNESITDVGAFIDNVRFVRDEGWIQEYSGVINGTRNPNAFSGGIGLSKPTFCDIDGDDDQDLFVGEYDGYLNFYRNAGTKFSPKWTFVTGKYGEIDVGENSAPVFHDLDRDGDYDLIVGSSEGTISFFKNVGSQRHAVWKEEGKLRDHEGTLIDVGDISTPAFSDLDGDDHADLLIGNSRGNLTFYRNQTQSGEANWMLVTRSYLRINVGSLGAPTFADIDGDGKHELFTGSRKNSLAFFKRTDSSDESLFSRTPTNFDSIEVGDFTAPAFADIDGDEDLDLCIGQADGNLILFRNEGDKHQWKFQQFDEPFDLQTVHVGFQAAPSLVDLDSDGDLDLVLGNANGKFDFYENVGIARAPEWNLVPDYFENVSVENWATPRFVDIDADGDLDLFSGTKSGNLAFFRNEGSKTKPAWKLVSDSYLDSATGGLPAPEFADVDGDGDYDLFVGVSAAEIYHYENVGTPRKASWELRTETFQNLKHTYRTVPVFVDVDNDGDLDLFTGTRLGKLIFFENVGGARDPNFELVTRKYNEIDVRFFSFPAFGDIDGDDDLDLLLGTNSGGVYFWRNFRNEPTYIDRHRALVEKPTDRFSLNYVIPQPFKRGATIRYVLTEAAHVNIAIQNLSGKVVKVLVDEHQTEGEYTLPWDGEAADSKPMSEGLYLVSFSVDGETNVEKLVLMD